MGLAEVLARPLDDAPRIALADALWRAGDARGRFIVAQCRLASRGLLPTERATLRAEVAALLARRGAEWAGPAAAVAHVLRRGFVDEIEAPAAALAPLAAAIFASQPVTRLVVTGADADNLAPLAEAGAFARALRLTVRGALGAEGARVLAAALAARATPLDALNLGDTGLDARAAGPLADALRGCRRLALTNNRVGDAGAARLANAPALAALETLYLTNNELTDEGARALATSAVLGSLARLGLARNGGITASGLGAIATSKRLGRLRRLEYCDAWGDQSIAIRRP